jgi:hypothetical protein
MPRIWYSVSLSTSLDRRVDFTLTLLTSFLWAHDECKSSHGPALFHGSWTSVLEGGGPDPQSGKKKEKLYGDSPRPHACV